MMTDGRPYQLREALRELNARGGPRERVWDQARQAYRRGVVALVEGHDLTADDLDRLAAAMSVLDLKDADLESDCVHLATVALVGLVTGTPVPPVRLT